MPIIDPVELTQALVRLKSVNPPGQEMECAALVAELLAQGGFAVSVDAFGPERASVVARRGDAAHGAPICLTGHLDTVPLGSAPWSVDPFGGNIVDGRLYGRGASDMKSGVAAIVTAALALGDELDEGPGVVLVLTGGEETGCEGARHLLKDHGDIGAAGAIIVGEPTSNQPRIGHKGVLWLAASCQGRAAHGAMPELGVNAIYRGMEIVTKLRDFGFNIKPHETLGSPTLNVGRIEGGANINSVPDLMEVSIDIRTLPGMLHDAIIEDLRHHLAPELNGLTTILDLDGVWTPAQHPWVVEVCDLIARHHDHAALGGVPFFTDASVLTPAFGGPPTLILGPGEPEMAHQTDEFCVVSRIHEAVEIYTHVIRRWQRRPASRPEDRSVPELAP